VPGVPEFAIASDVQYTFPMFEAAMGLVCVDHQFVGRSYSAFNPDNSLEMGDYHLVNLRAGLMFESWEVSLFAKNLFDDDATVAATSDFIFGDRVNQLRPRTIGLNVRVRF